MLVSAMTGRWVKPGKAYTCKRQRRVSAAYVFMLLFTADNLRVAACASRSMLLFMDLYELRT